MKKLNNLIVHCASSIVHQSKTLTLLLVMLMSVNMWGESYTITFKTATNDGSTEITSSTKVGTVISSGTDYVSGFTSNCSKAYYNGKSGVKLGSGSASGTLEFNIASDYQSNIKKITVVSANYSSDKGTLTLYSGSTSLASGNTPGTDFTHTFTSATKVSSIKLTTSKNRAYITSITLETEEAQPIDVTLSRHGSTTTISGQTSPYSLPAAKDEDPACDGWEFKGWSKGEVSSTTTAPTFVTQATATDTYYAVYGKTEGSGGTEEFNFETIANAKGWENSKAYTPVTQGVITLNGNGGGNNAKYYTSDKTWRMYNGGTVEITSSAGGVSSVSSNPEKTFTISSGKATLSVSASTNFKSITVTYGSSTTTYKTSPDCAAPGSPVINASNVDLAYSATSGEIAYTIDNPVEGKTLAASEDVDWISEVAVGEGKVTFTAAANTGHVSRNASITLNYGEGLATKSVTVTQAAAPYSTIADLFNDAPATAADVNIAFGNWVVSGIGTDNKSVYVTDNAGKGFVIYGSNHGFAVGDVLSGTATCKFQLYTDGFLELTNLTSSTSGLTVTKNGIVTPQTIAIAGLGGINTGAVITFSNILYNGTNFTDGTNVIKPYNKLLSSLPSLTSGKKYNATGVYIQYGAIKEIAPRTSDDIQLVTYDITINIVGNGTVTSSPANKACEGDEVALTINPTIGYRLSSLSVTDADGNPVEVTENKFTMPAGNVTVSAVFEEIQKRDVTLHIGNVTKVISQVLDDTKFFEIDGVPTPDDDAAGSCANTFMGWAISPIVNGPTDAAGFEAIKVTSSTVIDADHTNFYAVFATASDGGKTENWEITPTNFDKVGTGSGYPPYNGTHTLGDYSYVSYQVMLQENKVQFQSNTGYLYNTTSFGKITKIEITGTSAVSVFDCAAETSSTPQSGAITATGSGPYTYTFSGNNGFFHIKGGNSTPKATSIKVYYAVATYSNYITSCKHAIAAAVNDEEMGTLEMYDAAESGNKLENGNYAEGTNIWFRKEAKEGYEFFNWSVTEGANFDEETGKLIVGSMDVTVTANFRLIPDVTYDITIEQPTGATISASKTTGLAENEEVTLSYDLTDGYKFNSWTITGAEVTVVDNKFNMPASDITVSANISKIPEYNIVWKANGETITGGSEKVLEGNHVAELPAAPATCDATIAFMGWTNALIATPQDDAPSVLFSDAASAPVISGLADGDEVTYYAVYAEDNSQSGNVNDVWDLTSEKTDWTKSNCELYFSQPYGMKKANAYIINKSIKNLEDYASKASKIKIGVKCLQNGGTGSKLTITLVDADGNAVGTGKVITPTNTNAAGNTKYAYVEFDAAAATGYQIKCTTFDKNILINGVTDTVFYTQLDYSAYSTTCEEPLTEAPSITPETGSFCSSVNDITLTDNNGLDNTNLYYRVDDAVEWTLYNSESKPAISTTGEHTLYAKAVRGTKESPIAQITYKVLQSYTLSEAAAIADATAKTGCFTFSDLVVTGAASSEVFLQVKDNAEQVYMIKKSSHGYKVGDVLSAEGAQLSFVADHGVLEFTSINGIVKAEESYTPVTITKTIDEIAASDYGKLVKINGLKYAQSTTSFSDEDGNTITAGKKFMSTLPTTSWPDGAGFNVTGVITYAGEDLVLSSRNADDAESTATPMPAPDEQGLAITDITSSGATFNWTPVIGAAGYEITYTTGETSKTYTTKDGAKSSYTPNTAMVSAAAYTWTIKTLGDNLKTKDSDPVDGPEFTTYAAAKLIWMANGKKFDETTAVGEKAVLPQTNPTSECAANYEDFVCWVKAPIEGKSNKITQEQRVDATTAAKCTTTVAVTYTYYAAFGKVETPAKDIYTKVTAAPTNKKGEEDWTGDYLISYSEAIFANGKEGGTNGIGKQDNSVDLSEAITDNTIDGSKGNPYYVTIESCEDGYLLKTQDGNYNYKTDNDNGIDISKQVGSADNYPITISMNDAGTVHMLCPNGAKFQYNTGGYFRFYKSTSAQKDCYLYKRTQTPTSYSAYITSCPTTYTVELSTVTGGTISASKEENVEAGEEIELTATPSDGYTTTKDGWTVLDGEAEEVTVKNNKFTMPGSDVIVDYTFTPLEDQFVDNLHGNETKTAKGGGTEYVIPTLPSASEGTGCNAYYEFYGWTTDPIFSDAPAESDDVVVTPEYADNKTYYALWMGEDGLITNCCNTPKTEEVKSLSTYQTATAAKLQWLKVEDATKYCVVLAKGDEEIERDTVAGTVYTYETKTLLEPNVTYNFSVKAFIDCWGDTARCIFTTVELKSSKIMITAENGQVEINPELQTGQVMLEGTEVTLTATTTEEGYYFKEWASIDAPNPEIEGNTVKFIMPGQTVHVTATFAEYPKVTWKMAGQEDIVTSSVPDDDKFVIGADNMQPAPATWSFKDEYYKEFAGWMVNDDLENPVFATATTEVPAEGLVVNGAVAKSAKEQYQLVTDVDNLAAGDELVIVGLKTSNSQYYAAGDISGTNNYLNAVEIAAPVDDIITIESEDVLVFTLGGTTDAWTFKANDKYLASSGSKANLWNGDYKTWKLANSSTDNMVVMTSVQYTSGKFEFNMSSPRFKNYENNSCAELYFYRYYVTYDNLTINPGVVIRSGLTNNKIGTMCQAKEIVAVRGGTLYQPNYEANNYLEFIEVELPVAAGMPLIYQADGTNDGNLAVVYGEEKVSEARTEGTRGMVGYIGEDKLDVPNYSESNKNYVFQNNKLLRANQNYLINDRAYVSIDAVHALEPIVEEPIAAPRRRLVMDVESRTTPTGWDDVLKADNIRKLIINDKMYILRAGKMYDATGKFVK